MDALKPFLRIKNLLSGRPKNPDSFPWFTLLFFVVGFTIVVVSFVFWRPVGNGEWLTTTGVVVMQPTTPNNALSEHSTSKDGTQQEDIKRLPVVLYYDQSGTGHVKPIANDRGLFTLKEGTVVKISYNPDLPDQASFANGIRSWLWSFSIVVGLFIIILDFWMLHKRIKNSDRKRRNHSHSKIN